MSTMNRAPEIGLYVLLDRDCKKKEDSMKMAVLDARTKDFLKHFNWCGPMWFDFGKSGQF